MRKNHTMKTTTLAIAAAMMAGMGGFAGEPLILPLVPEGSGGWRYSIGPQGHLPNFAALDFDDSDWLTGESPFGFGPGCQYPVATNWPINTDLLLRRTIEVPATSTVRVLAAIDNDVQSHLNGIALGPLERFDGCADGLEYQVEVAVEEAGSYVIAIRARDRGGESFVDIRIEAVFTADCNDDGIVDYGQILDGTFEDANENGVPDACECFADVNRDGIVNGADISAVLGFWGLAGKPLPAADITRDGIVDGADLAVLLGSWGECP